MPARISAFFSAMVVALICRAVIGKSPDMS
jgi:hypothetical protein